MTRTNYRPDCGYAWVVVFACFTISYIVAGLARASGVLYLALIEEYSISREEATTPFSTRFCVRNMAGPLVGVLGQKFGIRSVVVFGGIISAIGCAVSSVSPSITWITLSWGGIHGLGYGLSNTIHLIMINRYFEKLKGIAVGIALTGDCFASLMLPTFFEYCLLNYGLKGTFLLTAGISLHIIPAAMLLISPPWESKSITINNQKKTSEKILTNKKIESAANEGTEFEPVFQYSLTKDQHQNAEKFIDVNKPLGTLTQEVSTEGVYYLGNCYEKMHNSYEDKNACNKISTKSACSLKQFDKSVSKERTHLNGCLSDISRKNSQISIISCPSHLEKLKNTWKQSDIACNLNRHSTTHYDNPSFVVEKESDCCTVTRKWKETEGWQIYTAEPENNIEGQKYCDGNLKEYELSEGVISDNDNSESNFIMFLKTNIKPMFLLISITLGLYMLFFISVITIIIDFATDNGLSIDSGKYLLIGFSVTDIMGRLGFGVVLDKRWISHSLFAAIITFLMGLFTFIIPFYKDFIFIFLAFSACGFVQGGSAIMYPILVDDYMEKNEQSIALGSINLYGGLLSLPIPAMIGYFRDYIGFYDGVFWTAGGLCMFNGFLWMLEPCILWLQEKLINNKDIDQRKTKTLNI